MHIMTSFPAGHTHTRYEGKLSMPSPSYPSTPPPSSSSSSRTLAIVSVPLAVVALSAPFLLIGYKRKLPFLPTAVKPIKEALHVISRVRAARGILPKSRGTNSNNCKNATPWKLLDLGSGDGRICTIFAKFGEYNSVGYELNPVLIVMSYYRAWRSKVLNRVTFHCADFAHAKIDQFDVIFMFGVNSAMSSLETRIATEAKENTFVVCYRFPLRLRKPIHRNGDLHIYLVGKDGADGYYPVNNLDDDHGNRRLTK